jgi:hypothetical protein
MNDTTTAPALAHFIHVADHAGGHVAECSCGWVSDWEQDWVEADLAGDGHVADALVPAEPMDEVISALLDLQDDLAAVVIWLAENWSTDLPVPVPYVTGGAGAEGDPAVVLMARCSDRPTVNRVARLLGVAPGEETEPDEVGHRYRQASRGFGRVSIDAFTDLGHHRETRP